MQDSCRSCSRIITYGMSPCAASVGPLTTVGCSPRSSPCFFMIGRTEIWRTGILFLCHLLRKTTGYNSWSYEFPTQSEDHAISAPRSPIKEIEIRYSAHPSPYKE